MGSKVPKYLLYTEESLICMEEMVLEERRSVYDVLI